MICISADNKPSCRIFLNGELLIDQTLPHKKCLLTWSVGEPIQQILVTNTSEYKIMANGIKVRPGHTMSV